VESPSTRPSDWNAFSPPAVRIGMLACAYFITARVGLDCAHYQDNATLVWPPSGIALAALILFGVRLWPGVFLGTLALNLSTAHLGGVASLAVATGNTLEPVVGALLLNRFASFRPTFERVRDVIVFLAIGALGCTIVSATTGVAALSLTGSLGGADPWTVWLIWWLGDVGGVIVVAPVLFIAANGTPAWREMIRNPEFWAALVLVVALTAWTMSGIVPPPWTRVALFTPFPLIVWAGTRLGSRGAVVSSFAIMAIATFATARHLSPFVVEGTPASMMLLWGYGITIGATALTLAAATDQRILAEERLREEELRRHRAEREQMILRERERIVREMHDSVGGHLVSAISLLETEGLNPPGILEGLRRALDAMRMVIDSLDPDEMGLSVSLGKLRARLEPLLRRNEIRLGWTVADAPGLEDLTPEQSLHLLRIIQEAVTNVLQHASATSVDIRIAVREEPERVVSLEIEDDGCGMPADIGSGGIGIRNMKSRAAMLGAALAFDGEAPGTRIRVCVPLSA